MKKTKTFKQLEKALKQIVKLAEISSDIQKRNQEYKPPFAKGGIILKGTLADLEREEILRKTNCGLIDNILYDDPFISVNYLLKKHPFLTEEQAEELKEFCFLQTIKRKECYGDGREMLHQWIDYKLHIPKVPD